MNKKYLYILFALFIFLILFISMRKREYYDISGQMIGISGETIDYNNMNMNDIKKQMSLLGINIPNM